MEKRSLNPASHKDKALKKIIYYYEKKKKLPESRARNIKLIRSAIKQPFHRRARKKKTFFHDLQCFFFANNAKVILFNGRNLVRWVVKYIFVGNFYVFYVFWREKVRWKYFFPKRRRRSMIKFSLLTII